jgi:N-acetyl-gamma-glutamylphosphate reductase
VVDLSADYRFNPAWAYGLPERHGSRELIRGAMRVANPGCYATGMQCSLFPLTGLLSSGASPHVFGVSGYSGAGTNPSRKNDLKELADNLMPYALNNHMHEREVTHRLSAEVPAGIRFMPHVAPWFRGGYFDYVFFPPFPMLSIRSTFSHIFFIS